MKTIGNIIWFILTGLVSSLVFAIVGLILCVTIIGIPFGLQCFKLAALVLWPFGKKVGIYFDNHPFANVLWLIFFGWGMMLGFGISGILYCITIIGIPFGKQCFKLAKLSLLPFGATISD